MCYELIPGATTLHAMDSIGEETSGDIGFVGGTFICAGQPESCGESDSDPEDYKDGEGDDFYSSWETAGTSDSKSGTATGSSSGSSSQHTRSQQYGDGQTLAGMTSHDTDTGGSQILPLSSAYRIFSIPISKWNESHAASVNTLFKVETYVVDPDYILSVSKTGFRQFNRLTSIWKRVVEKGSDHLSSNSHHQ